MLKSYCVLQYLNYETDLKRTPDVETVILDYTFKEVKIEERFLITKESCFFLVDIITTE